MPEKVNPKPASDRISETLTMISKGCLPATFACLLGLGSPTLAQPFSDARQARSAYHHAKLHPKSPCSTLQQLTTAAFSVISSQEIAASGKVPAHCRVNGIIPLEIGFEVNLPLTWNGRLYMYGNGGLAGRPASSPARRQAAAAALAQGFATAYTDTGHDHRVEPGGVFAYHKRHALVDWGYRAVHLTVQAAKSISALLYGRAPKHSYFHGCSTGGRQALMSAQRFPADFDGILAGAPAADYSGLKFSQAWRVGALAKKPLTEAKVLTVAEHIYQQCDALDGLADGLISDPRRCKFNPRSNLPKCVASEQAQSPNQTITASTAPNGQCFNSAEIDALEKIYAPVTLAGKPVYPAHPVGSEVAGPTASGAMRSGWVPWLLNESGPVLLDLLGSDFFRYMAFVEDKPDYNWTEFDFQQAPDNLAEFRQIVDAVNPDLDAFANRGGKMLSYFGWADPDINPLTLLSYRDAVAARLTAQRRSADDFFRVFMVPGMFHCRGGPGPSHFDAMTPLIDWVEKGQPPQRITAAHKRNGKIQYSRPLCVHPKEAMYIGRGDVDAAASFRCATAVELNQLTHSTSNNSR